MASALESPAAWCTLFRPFGSSLLAKSTRRRFHQQLHGHSSWQVALKMAGAMKDCLATTYATQASSSRTTKVPRCLPWHVLAPVHDSYLQLGSSGTGLGIGLWMVWRGAVWQLELHLMS